MWRVNSPPPLFNLAYIPYYVMAVPRIRTISAEALLALQRPVKILDATWYPPDGGAGYSEFVKDRIANATYFNVDAPKVPSPYPHMLPTASIFASYAGSLGIKRDDVVVVYDKPGFLSAPRAMFLFGLFKHPEVYLLDNYEEYKRLNGALEHGEPSKPSPVHYETPAEADSEAIKEYAVADFEEISNLLASGDYGKSVNLLDARPHGRWTGETPEQRPGMKSGHIPGSVSVPFPAVLEHGTFKSPEKIKELLKEKSINPELPTIVMCGSGVTACVIKTALDPLLKSPARLYDGSWSEWARRAPESGVVKGSK